jgi:hypothetical protein
MQLRLFLALPALLSLHASKALPAESALPPFGARAVERAVEAAEAAPFALQGLDPSVFEHALAAWERVKAETGVARTRLAVIDYSLPSTARRLWIFDVPSKRCLFHELVAHGRGSGDDRATRFSNIEGSLQTSLGVFVTGDTYQGAHGRSLRLKGLEKGFNDNAFRRAIVMHAADYVDPALGVKQGRIGRSWGCPAVAKDVAGPVIDALEPGAVVFAWGPDDRWQRESSWLRPAQVAAR